MSQPNCKPTDEKPLIRKATIHDQALVYKMLCELENLELPIHDFGKVYDANLGNERIAYFVAEQLGEPVGFASCHIQLLLHHAALVGEIQEMFVYPDYRSMGVGKRLVRAIIDFALSQGAIQMEVTTNKVRVDTHRFYEREGFKNTHFKLVLNIAK